MISFDNIENALHKYNIQVSGVLHVGAHECEEMGIYNRLGVSSENIIWVDANKLQVDTMIQKGIPNVYHATISDKDDEDVTFHFTNNVQSSSILEFGTHLQEHPHVKFVASVLQKSITVDTFFKRNSLDASKYNMWNFDIQGAEMLALKGAQESLKYVNAIYMEVNEKELYKQGALLPDIDYFLEKNNFKRVVTYMTRHGWGDALYVRI